MSEAALGLLGLGSRAGTVLIGTSSVRRALQRGEVRLVILAGDHSDRTHHKVTRLAVGKGIPILLGPPAPELGRRLGCGAVQAAGIRDPALARGLHAKTAVAENVQEE
jgi:ribosomal protein L7Ae-like RNA K-turn-binding protein